ncbi:MAG TPA: hypothetical protein VJZ75_11095, partial [Candidatus Bathyarchaeia archaeon]|nr:hypothetical protein [Candidatus Bathyarchaeia archaeon]
AKPLNVALIIITILSLAIAGYSTVNPHVTTVTQQQFVTTTQSIHSTLTVMSVGTQTVTSSVSRVITINLPAGQYQYCNSYNCSPYAAPPGYPGLGCGPYTVASDTTVQCSGYLYADGSGCVDLLVPVDNGYSNNIQQYYYLQNLPASHPPIGSWVTVTGQLNQQGNNAGPNGGACPSSYINVTSIK